MSLINDMLKDLEARWPGRNDLAGTIAPADTGDPDVQDEGDPPPLRAQRAGAGKSGFLSNGRAIMIAVGVAAFVGVVLLERQTRPGAEPEATAVAPREPVAGTTPPPLQPSVPLPAETVETLAPIPPAPPEAAVDLPGTKASAPEAAAAEPATAVLLAPVPLGRLSADTDAAPLAEPRPVSLPAAPAPQPTVDTRIAALLADAENAFSRDHLTTPREDNAHDRYRAVLVLDPENSAARDGLERIQRRYLIFLKQAINEGETARMQVLEKKALLAGLPAEELERFKQSLLSGSAAPVGAPSPMPVATTATAPAPAAPAPQASTPTASSSSQPAVPPTRPEASPTTGVTAGFGQEDRKTAEDARRRLSTGDSAGAQVLLENFVRQHPQSQEAAHALLDLYLDSNRDAAAAALLERSIQLPADLRMFLAAQLDIRADRYRDALLKLQSQEPAPERAAAYFALRAGVHYKLEDYSAAARAYRGLIAFDGQNPSYWLGLAVALDAAREEGALEAYERVQQLAEAGATYAAYVQERINALSIDR